MSTGTIPTPTHSINWDGINWDATHWSYLEEESQKPVIAKSETPQLIVGYVAAAGMIGYAAWQIISAMIAETFNMAEKV